MLGGYRLATSVGGTLTGRGGNFVIIDDPMKSQDAQSEAARESTKQWYANTLLSRLDDKSKDAIVVVMQRLHVDDLVGHLLEQGGWTHLNLPAIAQFEHGVQLGEDRHHLRRPGDLLHPEREPSHVLDEFKRSMGSLDFAAQYQQAAEARAAVAGGITQSHTLAATGRPITLLAARNPPVAKSTGFSPARLDGREIVTYVASLRSSATNTRAMSPARRP